MKKNTKIPEASKEETRRYRNELLRGLSQVSQIGITMLVCVLAGVLIGNFLDSHFNTGPWLVIIFTLIGVGAAFRSLFELYKKM